MHSPIPVICDCCRSEGIAGEADFASLGDLLDFEPVPRKTKRSDGWNPRVQRAFIVALAATGSARGAARAVGKAQYGADQLRKAAGNEGFLAAWDRALELFQEKADSRIAAGIGAVAAESAAWSPPAQPWSRAASRNPRGRRSLPAPPPEPSPEQQRRATSDFIDEMLRKYLLKLGQERRARLGGRVIEADFYLRQMTWMEVALDCTSDDAWAILTEKRKSGHLIGDIAQSPMSRLLDKARRLFWAQSGDPPRPEHPRAELLEHDGGLGTEPPEVLKSGPNELSHKEQERIYEERHARHAREQVEWEAEARRDYERRRASGAAS